MEEYWDSYNGWLDCKNVGIGRNSKTDLFGQKENKHLKKIENFCGFFAKRRTKWKYVLWI